MNRSLRFWGTLVSIALIAMVFGATASADTVKVRFWSQTEMVLVDRTVPAGMSPVEAAVCALVAGPTQAELAGGISSRIPAGVVIHKLSIADTSTEIDLSAEVLAGLNEAALQDIFDQFRTTLGDFPSILSIKLTSGGKALSSYLPPPPQVGQPAAVNPISVNGVGLGGKKICVGPSHGKYWVGWWGWQRSDPCGFGEAVLEDTNSIRLVQFLKQYLTQDGATFVCPRQLDESDCCNSDTGLPWWKMCAESWLHHAGAPGSVWASYSGNTGADTATDRSSDDIRARPLWADNQGADIYIACHTNAGGAGAATGTETYYDSAMEHPAHVANSTNLATQVQNNVVDAIRSTFPAEPSWASRGVKDSTGNFGEIRIPDRPACLIELAFHDDCSRDASYLTDDFFRSVAEWGLYKGVCAYFGNTPTWDKYSDEYVSDTIPATMIGGRTISVSVTFRNRGVVWQDARGFRLGAVGESDPFAGTRYTLSGTIRPGDTYTFTFNMTAPRTSGDYTSDWRMVRDGYAWFGDTLTKAVHVNPPTDNEPPSIPSSLVAAVRGPSIVDLSWGASTDNEVVTGYNVYRDSVKIAFVTSGTTYRDSGLAAGSTHTYRVSATDASTNASALSNPATVTTTIEAPENTGAPIVGKTVDWQASLPNWTGGGWTSDSSACSGYTFLKTLTSDTSCANTNREAKWLANESYSGRGHWNTDVQVSCNYATVNVYYRVVKPGGADEGTNVQLDQCPRDGWYSILDADRTDLNIGGWRIHTADTSPMGSGGCSTACGAMWLGAAGLHMYGDRWQYINDWTCLGGFASTAVADSPGFDETSAYLYPAVDRTHGDVFLWNGKAPGRVTTGDCNNANSLNFKGNANAYGGGDDMNSYGMAWIYAPGGAGPKFLIGSDDGNRVWVNGALKNDNNSARGLTRDQDETAGIGIPAGWSRVLFKVHNVSGGFEGAISLRNGGDRKWNEPSCNVFDMGGYLSYGLGYEQDNWYPRIDVIDFDGVNNPQPAAAVYTNTTTVTASGSAWVTGPVPLWKVMHYESGYGLSGDTTYADVSSSGGTWSHTQADVTGHRRFHFFGVSQSHRTSFQSGPGSGASGGSNWADGGPGNYMDAYVDNIAPQTPSLSTLTAVSTSSINLDWALPLDQGVGVGPGADEYASTGGDNAYRRGDVGVSVRRNGSVVLSWSSGTSFTDTSLTANTQYSYDVAARDNSSQTRGAWTNATAYGGATTRWTLSVAPSVSNVTCDRPVNVVQTTAAFTFTAVGGFGAGALDHYLYVWDKNPTHTFTGSESSWSSGTLPLTASSQGDWYLHVEGVNGEGAANGTLDLGPYRYGATPVDTIALAFAQPDSQPLSLMGKAVTAALPGVFWLEETNRSAAIEVLSGTSIEAGHLVNVVGSLGMSGAQRALLADTVDDQGLGAAPNPLFTIIRSLGGSDFNASTPGVTMCKGLYNIGLLVRIAGSVTHFNVTDPNGKFFYVDDGSGPTDDSGHSGVKVLCRSIDPPVTGMAIVTGVVSSEQVGANVVPRLIIRNSDDIKPL